MPITNPVHAIFREGDEAERQRKREALSLEDLTYGNASQNQSYDERIEEMLANQLSESAISPEATAIHTVFLFEGNGDPDVAYRGLQNRIIKMILKLTDNDRSINPTSIGDGLLYCKVSVTRTEARVLERHPDVSATTQSDQSQ